MSETETQQLSAEWRAIVLSELKAIRDAQVEMRRDITNQMVNSSTKEDFNNFQDRFIKIDERLSKIENTNNKFIGATIILNILFIGFVQYIINFFKTK